MQVTSGVKKSFKCFDVIVCTIPLYAINIIQGWSNKTKLET